MKGMTHRSWEHSQSMKAESRVVAGSGGGPAGAEDADPLATGGGSGSPLRGRASSASVSRWAAFSCVNQSVRCSSLHPEKHGSEQVWAPFFKFHFCFLGLSVVNKWAALFLA